MLDLSLVGRVKLCAQRRRECLMPEAKVKVTEVVVTAE